MPCIYALLYQIGWKNVFLNICNIFNLSHRHVFNKIPEVRLVDSSKTFGVCSLTTKLDTIVMYQWFVKLTHILSTNDSIFFLQNCPVWDVTDRFLLVENDIICLLTFNVLHFAILQTDEQEVINFLLTTEIIPLCLRIMESGSELSKTVRHVVLSLSCSPLIIPSCCIVSTF